MPKKNFDIKSSDCTKIVFARSYNMSSIAHAEKKIGEESKEKNLIHPASENKKRIRELESYLVKKVKVF